MKIGFCGLGKLGFPVALAIESKGHEVFGYDIDTNVVDYLSTKTYPHVEKDLQPLLDKTNLKIKSLEDVVLESEILFMPIQTPHEKEFEGITELPRTRKDFDYTYLKKAIEDVTEIAQRNNKSVILVVISTCLPGTFKAHIKPLLNKYIKYVYNPSFIAMGTVIDDYLNPEFSLIGVENEEASQKLQEFYTTIHNKPHVVTDITTAEGIKVFYNTFITAKTLLANAWMQTAHKIGMNVDDITTALSYANNRLISPKYMKGGGPDSGGCHPRDLIALSWLGEHIKLKPNLFEMMAQARQEQTEWTADLIEDELKKENLPVYILGKAFKPESNLIVGSGAILLANILASRGIEVIQYDPKTDNEIPSFKKGIYFVATEHKEFKNFNFPAESVVLDLWRFIDKSDKYKLIQIGNNYGRPSKIKKITL